MLLGTKGSEGINATIFSIFNLAREHFWPPTLYSDPRISSVESHFTLWLEDAKPIIYKETNTTLRMDLRTKMHFFFVLQFVRIGDATSRPASHIDELKYSP